MGWMVFSTLLATVNGSHQSASRHFFILPMLTAAARCHARASYASCAAAIAYSCAHKHHVHGGDWTHPHPCLHHLPPWNSHPLWIVLWHPQLTHAAGIHARAHDRDNIRWHSARCKHTRKCMVHNIFSVSVFYKVYQYLAILLIQLSKDRSCVKSK